MDKFTDYVSDTVVAPVRETAAQALGYAAAPLGPKHLARVAGLLAKLEDLEDWKVGWLDMCLCLCLVLPSVSCCNMRCHIVVSFCILIYIFM